MYAGVYLLSVTATWLGEAKNREMCHGLLNA